MIITLVVTRFVLDRYQSVIRTRAETTKVPVSDQYLNTYFSKEISERHRIRIRTNIRVSEQYQSSISFVSEQYQNQY